MSDVFERKLPQFSDAVSRLYDEVMKAGKLDEKTKELIAIALSVATKCEPCIKYHVKSALKQGATEEEVVEAVAIAIAMMGLPTYGWSSKILANSIGKRQKQRKNKRT
jgi:AhpD family alkylhydroperoxidase